MSRLRASRVRSATVRGMDAREPSGLELLTVGLVVFFVALILVVAGLLLMPTLAG